MRASCIKKALLYTKQPNKSQLEFFLREQYITTEETIWLKIVQKIYFHSSMPSYPNFFSCNYACKIVCDGIWN